MHLEHVSARKLLKYIYIYIYNLYASKTGEC